MSTGGDYLKLPLPEKMRLAAIVLEECDERLPNDDGLGWTDANLLYYADVFEAEDTAAKTP